jgi:putative SOS response-associated peptidase YedK
MCNRYFSPPREQIGFFGPLITPDNYQSTDVFPRGQGAFIRASKAHPELVVGQWGLVPHFAKSKSLTYSTNNARIEGTATTASYKLPWNKGQRCIIPAAYIYEPCWETGKNVWWIFRRADGNPWALAGLWNTWIDRDTGEVVESYTMLTQNADVHPIMNRMHKPDPKLLPDQQDKRSVVAIESGDFDQWLNGTVDEAKKLIQLTPVELFDARAAI